MWLFIHKKLPSVLNPDTYRLSHRRPQYLPCLLFLRAGMILATGVPSGREEGVGRSRWTIESPKIGVREALGASGLRVEGVVE
jgi:hypothetical protein